MITTVNNLHNKSHKKKKRKFKILLDSAFVKPQVFPLLSNKANLTHIVNTYGLPPDCSDEEIYKKAVKEDRFILTINFKDFKKLVKKGKLGIIGIESRLSNKEIDNFVSNFISGKDPDDFIGKAVKI